METEVEKKERLEAAHEVSKDLNLLKKKLKKCSLIFGIVLIVMIIIKLIFGTIEIYNPFGYPVSSTPSFETRVNGERCGTSGGLYHRIPIIPFFLDFVSFSYILNYFEKDQPDEYFYNGIGDVNLSIRAYTCHYKDSKSQVACDYTKDNMVYNSKNDIRYTKVRIIKDYTWWEPVYDGPFITNITEYVKDDGYYMVTIYSKYSMIETESHLWVETKTE